jgi:hypothetical protein
LVGLFGCFGCPAYHVFFKINNASAREREYALVPASKELQLAVFLFELALYQRLVVHAQVQRPRRVRAQIALPILIGNFPFTILQHAQIGVVDVVTVAARIVLFILKQIEYSRLVELLLEFFYLL